MEKNVLLPPKAEKKSYKYNVGNNVVYDDYQWLKNWPEKDIPNKTLSYLKEENEYTNKFFNQNELLQQKIFEELKNRIKLTDQSEHIKRDNYYYYTKTEEDKQYPIFCRKKNNLEEVILDQNTLAQNNKFINISSVSVSPNHKLLAYSVDYIGNEIYTIYIVNLNSNNYLNNVISNTSGEIVWHENSCKFLYINLDDRLTPNEVLVHDLEKNKNLSIYKEKKQIYNIQIKKSASKKYFFIKSLGHSDNEIRIISMNDKNHLPKLIKQQENKIIYDVENNNKNFYIRVNDRGNNFRLLKVNEEFLFDQDKWEEYIPLYLDMYLKNFYITNKYLILNYTVNSIPKVQIIDLDSNKKSDIKFFDEVYEAYGYSTNYEEDDIRIFYSSLKRPDTIYQYNFIQDSLSVIKQKEILDVFDSEEYELKRIWAENEKIKIPITLFYKKSLFKNNNNLYLIGYGAYGINIPVSFYTNTLTLVNRGVIFAVAHIRGGSELGKDWYEDGKLLNKKNTFNDFICCAKKLISEKYTSTSKIVISGGSAGGLLIGAVLNQCPELYKGAILEVPFVDALNTMLDPTLPLTIQEYNEWGNPNVQEYFDYIKSYSPYENIKSQNYPNILVTTSMYDSRVGYWEAAKWVAKLRSMKLDNNLLLLKLNMNAGHKGNINRFEYLKEIAKNYVFIFNVLSIEF